MQHHHSVNTPILETDRFNLRALQLTDLTEFARYRAIESIAQFQPWQNFTYDDALALFNRMDYSLFGQHDHWFQLAITDKNNGNILGDLAVHFIDEEKAEVGFTIAPDNQRKGVAYEALNALLTYLFSHCKKKKVVAFVDINNKASFRLLEKSGFIRVRQLKAHESSLGQWGDEYVYVKLPPINPS